MEKEKRKEKINQHRTTGKRKMEKKRKQKTQEEREQKQKGEPIPHRKGRKRRKVREIREKHEPPSISGHHKPPSDTSEKNQRICERENVLKIKLIKTECYGKKDNKDGML